MKIHRAVQNQCHQREPVENSTQPVALGKLPYLFRYEWEYNNSIQGGRKQATENDEY